jgi:alkanesulfonate monooxygenase SsuD/methylene tetrahydromethanopterin reductase-like flavin-dependent oxidoreductase (luciferase family)
VRIEFGIWDQVQVSEAEVASNRTSLIYDDHLRQVELAESLGFDHYYMIEHQSSFFGHISSPTVMLAALSQRTSTIRLGAMIWQLPFHNPMRLAQDVATLDQLSNGRVEFGTGLGVHEHEFIRWNLNFDSRQEMAEEALEIILRAWTQPEVTYKGKYWQFEEALPMPKPFQKPYPPVWAGVHSRRSIEFAAEHGLNVAQNIDTDAQIAEKFDYFRQVWAGKHGESPLPKTFLMRSVFVAETDELAHDIASEHVPKMYRSGGDELRATRIGTGTSQYLTGPKDTQENKNRREVFASVAKSYQFALDNGIVVVGSPESVAKRVQEQRDVAGIDVYCCNFFFAGMDPALVEASMTLFGRHVIPALR